MRRKVIDRSFILFPRFHCRSAIGRLALAAKGVLIKET